MKNSSNESIFVIFTDAVGSSDFDRNNSKDTIEWRIKTFARQLAIFLDMKDFTIIKSIGDSLFIKACLMPNQDESQFCKTLLQCLLKLFLEHNSKSKIPKIRIAVHKLNKFNHGSEIQKELRRVIKEAKYEDSSKYINFLDSLKDDLFGHDVNKSARIQGIVKEPIILVSDAVVNSLGLIPENNEIRFDNCILHSSVPIVYLKGIIDISDPNNKESLFYIWQLSGNNSAFKPILKFESKSYQTFRFLNANINLLAGYTIDDVYAEVYKCLFENNKIENKNLLSFFIDILLKVDDYFPFNKIDFARPIKMFGENNFVNFYNQKHNQTDSEENNQKKKNSQNNKIQIEGWFNNINLINKNNKIHCSKEPRIETHGKKTLIPFLTISSFKNEETGTKVRKIYEYENQCNDILKAIEPQTIKIHENILFQDNPHNQGTDCFILLFFGVYNEHIKDADQIGLFVGNLKFSKDSVPIAYGLISGLIDGFIFYKTTKTKYTSDIEILLNKLYSYSPTAKDFFDWVFPISIFLCSKYPGHPLEFSGLYDFSNYKSEKAFKIKLNE